MAGLHERFHEETPPLAYTHRSCALAGASDGVDPGESAEAAGYRDSTLRETANLVVVDVVVRDKDGHAIHGLKQSDFVLLENKSAQPIKHFEEHTSAEIAPTTAKPTMPPGVFTNFEAVSAKGPLNILLFGSVSV